MSNRRFQFTSRTLASSRQADVRIGKLLLNGIVISIVIVVAIIESRLADWTT
ncbi:MAG TPA: hypothetical protein VGB07_28995 [Blastocatellia bacterium]